MLVNTEAGTMCAFVTTLATTEGDFSGGLLVGI